MLYKKKKSKTSYTMLAIVAACGVSYAVAVGAKTVKYLFKPSIPLAALSGAKQLASTLPGINFYKAHVSSDNKTLKVSPVPVKTVSGAEWYLAGVNYDTIITHSENEIARTHDYLRTRFKDLYAGRETILMERAIVAAIQNSPALAKNVPSTVSAVKKRSILSKKSVEKDTHVATQDSLRITNALLSTSKAGTLKNKSVVATVEARHNKIKNTEFNKFNDVDLVLVAAQELTKKTLYDYSTQGERVIPKIEQLISTNVTKEASDTNQSSTSINANHVGRAEVSKNTEEGTPVASGYANTQVGIQPSDDTSVLTTDKHTNEHAEQNSTVSTYQPILTQGVNFVGSTDASILISAAQPITVKPTVKIVPSVVVAPPAVVSNVSPAVTAPVEQTPKQEQVAQQSAAAGVSPSDERVVNGTEVAGVSTRVDQNNNYVGVVQEAFTAGQRAVGGATVQILGSNQIIYTDTEGRFSFDGIQTRGVIPVRISKDGYRYRNVELRKGTEAKIELLNENAARVAEVATATSHESGGIVFAEIVDPEGRELSAYRMSIVSAYEAGHRIVPRYINELGTPDAQWSETSARGQAIFVGVPEGTYILRVVGAGGQEMAPHIIHVGVGEAIVSKFSLGQNVNVRAKLLSGQSQRAPVAGLRAQILGHAAAATSDRSGIVDLGTQRIDCNTLNYIQIDGSDLYRNRIEYRCAEIQNIYVMSSNQIESAASEAGVELSPMAGMVMGHITSRAPLRVQTLGSNELLPSDIARGLDFYFDDSGAISASQDKTSTQGNYVILNVPAGLSYVQFFSEDGITKYMMPILLSPSTVNISIR